MTTRRSATDRLERLLALVPWVAAHPEGVAVDEVCERFRITRTQLLDDIDTVMMIGVHPFTPDTLIEAWVDDDLVTIRYADEFAHPVRLTPHEAVTLLAAARALTDVPGHDAHGPLGRALTKLETAVGARGVDVALGVTGGEVFEVLRDGIETARQVEIDYPTRDGARVQTRRIEPAGLLSSSGRWYVSGWCHQAGGPRVFRVDRIIEARSTDLAVTERPDVADIGLGFDAGLPRVTLGVDAASAWALEGIPVLERRDEGDTVYVELAIASPAWLARLLVRLGSAARVVTADPTLDPVTARRVEARKILARYR